MPAQPIKEFLVSVKYAQDQESLRTLRRTLGSLLKEITAFGAGAATGMAGLILALNKTADALADVYYQAQLAGTTGAELKKLKFAGDQINHLGDSLVSMAVAIQSQLRTIPPYATYLRELGVQSEDTKNTVNDLYEIVKRYHEILEAGGSQTQERLLLKQAGLDPDTIFLLAKNWKEFNKEFQSYNELLAAAGIKDLDKALLDAVKYQREWNSLWEVFSLSWYSFADTLLPHVQNLFSTVLNVLKEHQEEIGAFFDDLSKRISELDSPENLKNLHDNFTKLVGSIHAAAIGIKDITDNIRAIAPLIGLIVGGRVGGALGALLGLGAGMYFGQNGRAFQLPGDPGYVEPKKQAPGLLERGWEWFKKQFTPSPNAPGGGYSPFIPAAYRPGEGEFDDGRLSESHGLGRRMFDWLMGSTNYAPWVKVATDPQQDISAQVYQALKSMGASPGAPSVGAMPTGDKQQGLSDAVTFFMSRGLSQDQAVGVVARLARESGGNWLNPNAVNPTSGAYGIAQWLGGRKGAALATGGSLQQQLQLVWRELSTTYGGALQAILHARSPEEAAIAMEMFERAGNPAFTAGAAKFARELSHKLRGSVGSLSRSGRGVPDANIISASMRNPRPAGVAPLSGAGGTNVTMTPTTTIHVHGGGPEIGAYVFNAQRRVNADLVRNLTSAIV